jgi:glycosyltransferase involved in cell wall biosynthesis
VHFIEQVPYEVYVHILQISSAHVYLTYPFVLSWSLLEAMSTCCPVVASNTGPVTEVVKHNHNGLLVNFFEPNQIAESVDKLLTDEALANKLGLAARKTIETNYSLPAMLNRQMKLIKNN